MFGRVFVFQADLLVFSWYLLFIAGGRKKPWRGLKKSAGAKKNPSGGGKNTPARIVHQHTGGETKTDRVFFYPRAGSNKNQILSKSRSGVKRSPGVEKNLPGGQKKPSPEIINKGRRCHGNAKTQARRDHKQADALKAFEMQWLHRVLELETWLGTGSLLDRLRGVLDGRT